MERIVVYRSERFFVDDSLVDIQERLDEAIIEFNINIDDIINVEIKEGFQHSNRFWIYVRSKV